MELRADSRIAFPRPVVFRAYRDNLADVVPYLPNVNRIEVKSREDDGPVSRLVNIWHGGGEIPAAAKAFLSEAMLAWTDRATWNEKEWTCQWQIETHAFTEAVKCEGENRYIEIDGGAGTLLEIRGNLTIDGKALKGVPGFLSGKVARALEEFLGKRIQPNLLEVSAGIGKYLAAKPSHA